MEHTNSLYFCDDDEDDPAAAAAGKESEYGSYPLPDY